MAGIGVAVCVAIVPLVLLIHANSLWQVDWIKRSNPTAIAYFVANLVGGDGGAGRIGRICGLFVAASVFGLMTVGIIGGWRSRETRASVIVASTWFVVPLALGIAVDPLIHP